MLLVQCENAKMDVQNQKRKPKKTWKNDCYDFITFKYIWATLKDCIAALMAVQVFVVGFHIYNHYLFIFFLYITVIKKK